MKVLITSDFYSEYELYETDNLAGLKNYVALMANGGDTELDPKQYKLLGTDDNITTEDVIKMADEIIYISDYEEYEECDDYSGNMHCDTYGICGGSSCSNYPKCQGWIK